MSSPCTKASKGGAPRRARCLLAIPRAIQESKHSRVNALESHERNGQSSTAMKGLCLQGQGLESSSSSSSTRTHAYPTPLPNTHTIGAFYTGMLMSKHAFSLTYCELKHVCWVCMQGSVSRFFSKISHANKSKK
eukprot:1157329-Pelagomonas_calceolata.AAC.2